MCKSLSRKCVFTGLKMFVARVTRVSTFTATLKIRFLSADSSKSAVTATNRRLAFTATLISQMIRARPKSRSSAPTTSEASAS